ncbi:MAG: threonine--tRNA ligase [Actinomycetota bacterium]|nr:threonine--tRNA ligase [Actinomycetota bacterium]
MPIKLTFPDGTVNEFPAGTSGGDVAAFIGRSLTKAAVAVSLDGELLDLSRSLPGDGSFAVITDTTDQGRSVIRHSAAHVLAQAVLDLYPGASFAIGPAIEDGFYYDFDIGRGFVPEDLEAIEARMTGIIAEDQPFHRDTIAAAEAKALFADQPFKIEIIEGVDVAEGAGGTEVSVYRNLGFVDLCRGPHLPSTGRIKAVKLLRSAGSYWRGDENKPQLQRIYGTAWESQQALTDHLERIEQARLRDHRRLGHELDLFSSPPELGPGLSLWHPKGGLLRKVIDDYSRRIHQHYGFDFVVTPHVAKEQLWAISGHLDFYADNMYPPMELDGEEAYRVKPMNCPFHVLIYRSSARSYRQLPLRLSELGAVYRYERSGTLQGLLRVRGMVQDDSHSFCRRDQLADELDRHLDFVLTMFSDLGFDDVEAELSTRDPGKWMGELDLWDEATEALRATLDKRQIAYDIGEGEAAFYGPKIDVHVRDALGRRWQCSTIQLDFNFPEAFDLGYATADNDRARPVMIHCAKLGSMERFIAVMIEHYAGAMPPWMSPVQATVVPVADRHDAYAAAVVERLRAEPIRAEADLSDESLGEKVRRAITHKHPAVIVVGDRDVEAGTVGLRLRGESEERRGVPLADAVAELAALCAPPR